MAYIQCYVLHTGGRQLLKSPISKAQEALLLQQTQYKGVFIVEFSFFYEVLK